MDAKHIVFITDDNYVMPTLVSIQSIIENVPGKICIHICTFGLSETNIKKIKSYEHELIDIKFLEIDLTKYKEKFKNINQSSHVTPTALLKFDLAELFPEIDYLLYLDSDLIIRKDISELWEIDMKDYYVAASYEFWKYLNAKYNFQKTDNMFYFNSGVLFLNLIKIREDNISKRLWEIKFKRFNDPNNKNKMMDQDTLNFVLSENCYHLPIKYNCNSYFTNNIDIDELNKIYYTQYESCKDLFYDSCILHYVGKSDKPWLYLQGNCVNEWEKYYQSAGFSFDDLTRSVYTKGLKYKLERFFSSINSRGFFNTLKYIYMRNKRYK